MLRDLYLYHNGETLALTTAYNLPADYVIVFSSNERECLLAQLKKHQIGTKTDRWYTVTERQWDTLLHWVLRNFTIHSTL